MKTNRRPKRTFALKEIFIIFALGIFIYSNSLSNSFFADDYHQIIDNPTVHSFVNIPSYFTGSTFYTGGHQLSGNYYKPLLTTTYSILYAIFGTNPFGYHLFQIILYCINAILVFLLFKYFFKKTAAFVLSLLFLVHPINNETVVYIANMQDNLFLFFGLLSFIIHKTYPFSFKPIIVGLLLLFSLLSKETGVLFLFVIPLSTFLAKEKSWLKEGLISIIVFLVYLFMRLFVANLYFNKLITAPIMMLSLSERIMHIPAIIFFYIKTFFFPSDLLIFQTSIIKSFSFTNFYFPLLVDLFFFSLLIITGILIYKNLRNDCRIFVFFSIWFITGLVFHLQIFPLDGTVADRWFYFPIIGLLGIVGILIEAFWQKYHSSEVARTYAITALIIIVFIFSFRVMVRNTNWKNQLTIIAHDIKYNQESYQLEEGYGLELMKINKFDEAYPHLLKSTQLFPGVNNLTSLGTYYGNTKQLDKAKVTFEKAMQYDDLIQTYENYGLLLLLTEDIQKTELFTKSAVRKFPNSHRLWLYMAISSYALGHDREALQAAKNSHSLNPRPASEYVLSTIKNGKKIDLSKL